MKKLEIKHIAPYLPYGLKVQHESIDEDVTEICNIESLSLDCVTFDNGCDFYFDDSEYDNPIIKPLLRPLSDLYKEINGVVGIIELAKIEHPCSAYHILRSKVVEVAGDNQSSMSFKYDLEDNYFINSNFDCDDEYYPIMYQLDLFTYLFHHHYDIFGLIDKGLAIDLNSISHE